MWYTPETIDECLYLIHVDIPEPECNCHTDVPTDESIKDGTMWLRVEWCSEAMTEVIEPLVTDKGLEIIIPLIEAELDRDD